MSVGIAVYQALDAEDNQDKQNIYIVEKILNSAMQSEEPGLGFGPQKSFFYITKIKLWFGILISRS